MNCRSLPVSALLHCIVNVCQDALRHDGLQVIGAASPAAYNEYIAADESLAGLFESVLTGETAATASPQPMSSRARNSRKRLNGEKVAPDLREMMKKSPSDRVRVILQAEDIRSATLQSLFQRYGVEVREQFSQLGTLAVELPVNAIQELADSSATSYISLDREIRTLSDDDDDDDGGVVGTSRTLPGGHDAHPSGNSESMARPSVSP